MWNMVYFIDLTIKSFDGIMADFVENHSHWSEWAENDNPHLTTMPGDWSTKLS